MEHSRRKTVLALFLVCCDVATAAPNQTWFPQAPLLPDPTGEVIHATSVKELFETAETIKPGGTILVADGHYPLPSVLTLATDSVTLRSHSGERHSPHECGIDTSPPKADRCGRQCHTWRQ